MANPKLVSETVGDELRAANQRLEALQRVNAELEEKVEQLTLASHYKAQFLASMSHELRTPLNSLLILARLLVDNPDKNLKPKQIEYARTIHAAGTDLLTLISDIVDLAKIESGTVLLEIESARVSELVDYAERTFRQVATDRGLQFEIAADELLPAMIRTDLKRVQQILKNLLSNAFKFTERGKVTLRMSLAASGWSPGHPGLEGDFVGVLALTVEDTGIGMPESQRDAIFEAFRPGAGAAHYRGTGLGLPICRQLTRLLGGEIRVESTAGVGSRFTLYLPLKPGAESTTRTATHVPVPVAPRPDHAAELPKLGAGLAGRKILIIDDDIRNIFALTGALEEHGIRVVDAENGKAGLDLLQRQSDIDAVLMDIMMPDLDGFDSIRLIRGLKQFRELPIIAVTARAMKGDREKCIAAGATDYISKPVSVSHLLTLLKAWLVR